MPIKVLIVDGAKKSVTSKTIKNDNPNDPEIIAALTTKTGVDLHELATVADWSVIRVDGSTDSLIIGKAPQLSAINPVRKTCTLSDAEAKRLVHSVEFVLANLEWI